MNELEEGLWFIQDHADNDNWMYQDFNFYYFFLCSIFICIPASKS